MNAVLSVGLGVVLARVIRTGEGFETIKLAVKELDKLNLAVGWFESAMYDDNTPVAGVAAVQEFGHGATSPRPFMRPAIADYKSAWRDLVENGARAILKGKKTASDVKE